MITKPKGCYDITGVDASIYRKIEDTVHGYAAVYNYKYVRTPLFENEELFKRGVGESSDIVQKETYDFTDRSGRNMTLRPEGTAGIARKYIEDKLYGNANNPIKEYYFGTMYRYERPGLGRNREFTQFGIEALGSDDPLIDAEVISLSVNILRSLGLDVTVRINNLGSVQCREIYKKALVDYLKPYMNDMCEDCKKRLETNPLRVLDCKIDGNGEILKNAPSIHNFQSPESNERFHKVLEYLDYLDVNYESYFKTINYFMFYEFTEWIFVYNKYGLEKDDRFNYYYQKANLLADYLLRSQEV